MTPDERERLAELIADELRRALDRHASAAAPAAPWLAPPVRPAPPERGGAVPAWSGAAQALGDLVPVRQPSPSAHRADPAQLSAAVRAAAAGQGPARVPRASTLSGAHASSTAQPSGRSVAAGARRRVPVEIEVPVAISRRHLHLSPDHARALFGVESLDVHRPLRQPGQFAARQQVDVVGPDGRLERVRVVGPTRAETQLELSRHDAARLGIDPPLAASGALQASGGGVTVIGPNGRCALTHGVILAARHLHLSSEDGARWGMRDGDRVDVHCGTGARAVTWHNVLVRCGAGHATELHLDEDEGHAASLRGGESARILRVHDGGTTRRRLMTERDVVQLARRGESLPAGALYTPSARDRARALGIDLP